MADASVGVRHVALDAEHSADVIEASAAAL
jgi:hypothetical protein